MASINFRQLLEASGFNQDGVQSEEAKLVPGQYRTQVVSAKKGYSRNGRLKYTVFLIVVDGEYAGFSIKWDLVVVEEHPGLLHEFFANMSKVGVGRDFFATAVSHEDIVRQIVITGAYVDVTLVQGREEYLDVMHARRVIVP